jgi:hypothetical protein
LSLSNVTFEFGKATWLTPIIGVSNGTLMNLALSDLLLVITRSEDLMAVALLEGVIKEEQAEDIKAHQRHHVRVSESQPMAAK